MISLSVLSRLLVVPLLFGFRTIQYFTTGTLFDNALTKKSLKRTLNASLFRFMHGGLTLQDAEFVYKDIITTFKDLQPTINPQGDLPHYGEIFTDKRCGVDEDECTSLWLTRYPDKDVPVLIYIHGGCFAIGLDGESVISMNNFYRVLLDKGKKISVLIVDYSLTFQTNCKYPKQYNEIGFIYNKLVNEGYKNLIPIGESAGGILSLNILQYIDTYNIHQLPKAIIAISPWLNVSIQGESGSYLSTRDITDANGYKYFGQEYIGHDQYLDNSPIVNVEANKLKFDWKNHPVIKNDKLFILCGEYEILYDDIKSFIDYLGLKETNYSIEPKGFHMGFLANENIDYKDLHQWLEFYNNSKIIDYLLHI